MALATTVLGEDVPLTPEFPRAVVDLEKIRDQNYDQSVPRMRSHGWFLASQLFQSAAGCLAPLWVTWETDVSVLAGARDNVFSCSSSATRNWIFSKRGKELSTHTSLTTGAKRSGVSTRHPQSLVGNVNVVSFTLFNQRLSDQLRAKSAIDGHTLAPIDIPRATREVRDLISHWNEIDKPIRDLSIQPLPTESIAIKTAWWPLTRKLDFQIPVFNPADSKLSEPYPPKDWGSLAVVDLSMAQSCAPTKSPKPVNTAQFPKYSSEKVFVYQLCSQTSADSFNRISGCSSEDCKVENYDYIALVGFHFTTRELPDWIWGTLWWKPNKGAASDWKSNQTKPSYWDSYELDITFDMVKPYDREKKPKIIFNPYLEAGLEGGMQSNCVHCHRQAAWQRWDPIVGSPGQVIDPGDSNIFKGRIKTDFLWTLTRRPSRDVFRDEQRLGSASERSRISLLLLKLRSLF